MISHLTSVIYNTQQKAKHDFLSFGLSWGLFSIDNLIQFNAISTQHVRTRTHTQSIIETGATRRRLRRTYHFERALSHIEWFPQHTIIITIHIGDNMYSGVSTPLCQRESGSCKTLYAPHRDCRDCRDDAPTQARMCLCVCVFVFVCYIANFRCFRWRRRRLRLRRLSAKSGGCCSDDDDNIIAARNQFLVISRMTCPAFPWGVRTHTHTRSGCGAYTFLVLLQTYRSHLKMQICWTCKWQQFRSEFDFWMKVVEYCNTM